MNHALVSFLSSPCFASNFFQIQIRFCGICVIYSLTPKFQSIQIFKNVFFYDIFRFLVFVGICAFYLKFKNRRIFAWEHLTIIVARPIKTMGIIWRMNIHFHLTFFIFKSGPWWCRLALHWTHVILGKSYVIFLYKIFGVEVVDVLLDNVYLFLFLWAFALICAIIWHFLHPILWITRPNSPGNLA